MGEGCVREEGVDDWICVDAPGDNPVLCSWMDGGECCETFCQGVSVVRYLMEYVKNCFELVGLLMIWGVIVLVVWAVVNLAWGVVFG